MSNLCFGRFLSGVLEWSSYIRTPCNQLLIQQTRNTFILKRRWPPGLAKKGRRPRLKTRNFIYDLVEDTNLKKKEDLSVILTDYVQGLGDRGDRVTVSSEYAYNKLLLPGLAVYASPENILKYEKESSSSSSVPKFSSPSVERTLSILSRLVLGVVMNKETDWTLEPWHLRVSFRKAGILVPESAIEMPKETINGPNLSIEGKEFKIVVTVNKREKVPVRCRIHHWSTAPGDRLPFVQDYWLLPAEPLFPEIQETTLG